MVQPKHSALSVPEAAPEAALATVPAPEPAAAEAAFRSLERRLPKLGLGSGAAADVDVEAAALTALHVAARVSEPDVRERFNDLIAKGELDAAALEDLPAAALAAWFADHRHAALVAARSESSIPAQVLEEASSQRARMLDLLEDRVARERPEAARQIASIRRGQGELDLASHLIALAAMYDMHRAKLSEGSGYQPTDAKAARKLAEQILALLRSAPGAEQETWRRQRARAWSFLRATYEEVRRAGLALFSTEGGEERFPPLCEADRGPVSAGGSEDRVSDGESREGGEVSASSRSGS